jgi:hypothetical protein
VPQCAAALDPLLTLTSGFSRDDAWGFRACEPTRNIISSMALVLLKTGIVHPGDPDADGHGAKVAPVLAQARGESSRREG